MKQTVSIMTVNSGSSSLKLTVYKNLFTDNETNPSLDVTVSNIGTPSAAIAARSGDGRGATHPMSIMDHESALAAALRVVAQMNLLEDVSGIGHRIVFGGLRHEKAELVTDEVVDGLRHAAKFDPDHMPTSLLIVDALRKQLPGIPQVVCYDTAFFADLPRLATITSLPREYEDKGIRRYGYHGLSYEYLLQEFGRIAGTHAAEGRVIFAHMGSGVSLAALKDGRPVDMTMGFTPSSGVMMSTRSGDIDPGVSYFLQTELGMSVEEYYELINKKSGLLGVSGLTADMEQLVKLYDENERAAEAVDLFCYDIRKSIGALASTIGGVDSVVFTGGMGEHAPFIRQKICEELGYLGITLDRARNEKHLELISAEGSRVGVHVVPTDESSIIAALTHRILSANKTSG